jgi:hypothetical protein
MLYIHNIAVVLLVLPLHYIPAISCAPPPPPTTTTTRDTISGDQALSIGDKLVSKNGRYALGFFEAGTGSNSSQNTSSASSSWYLGIWFNSVSKFTPAWVANRDNPIKDATSLELRISNSDGNLLVLMNQATGRAAVWSTNTTQTNEGKSNTTIVATLLDSGNLIIITRSHNSSSTSRILWESFDHPTDTLFPGAKLGWDSITGLNRRLVSRKNSADPASGAYCDEVDPSGANQLVLSLLVNSSPPYWSSGVWNGQYFCSMMPEMSSNPGYTKSFVSNTHLFQSHAAVLKWSTRYQVALGVARGLAYLHDSCRDCIIHCDIKPENILLDDSFVPKIADFGMAKFLGRDFSRALTTMRGTIGYLAPEWISGVAITPKVDVYAYGMVLLEILSGRRNSCASCPCTCDHDVYYPVHVARKVLEEDLTTLLDDRLNGAANPKEVETICKLACWCIQDGESDRPTMGEVVQILEGLLVINIPPMPRLLQSLTGGSHSTCC